MFESVTVEQLARMLPRARVDDLARVLELCWSAEGDRVLRDLVHGERPVTASADVVEQLAVVYRDGRPR